MMTLAALTPVLQGREGTIIRFTLIPMLIFCLYVGIIGLVLLNLAG